MSGDGQKMALTRDNRADPRVAFALAARAI
jgi:hypothetical protein